MGGLKGPLIYQRRIQFLHHVAIDHLLLGIFGDHMQKFGPGSQKFNKISVFQNCTKLTFYITLTYYEN